MTRFILERCLNMTTIMGLIIGSRKKKNEWYLVALISASIQLGLLIGNLFLKEDDDSYKEFY